MKAKELKAMKEAHFKAAKKILTDAAGVTGLLDGPQALDSPRDEWICGMIKWAGRGILKKSLFREFVLDSIADALVAGEGKFLIRLGRTIQTAGTGWEKPRECDKLGDCLVRSWMPDPEKDWPGLCNFTDSALVDYCIETLNDASLTEDAVTKKRQRLGLMKAPKPSITRVRREKGKLVYDRRSSGHGHAQHLS